MSARNWSWISGVMLVSLNYRLQNRDTTCAIVGARVGAQGIPGEWREKRESLGAF